MKKKECVAMILAGGKGARLGSLTNDIAKPAVFYGGKYRIIDFTLSNCAHSDIDTLGVLTQYRSLELHDYIEDGREWHLDRISGSVSMLPSTKTGGPYMGTANAVYQNIAFADQFGPEYVLILSGDHVYKMDYRKMLDFHKMTGSGATIGVVSVSLEEASRFGIMGVDDNGRVTKFDEKPKEPKSNLASMGIYIFSWSLLKKYLIVGERKGLSLYDFGKNIIPSMLSEGEKLYAYQFDGYWKDVGTIKSLWESNMDLIADAPKLDLYDLTWEIFTKTQHHPPCSVSSRAQVKRSIIGEGCNVHGRVENAVLFDSVTICEGAEVSDSIVMPGAFIGKNARIHKSIIGTNVYIGEDAEIGAEDGMDIFLNNELCTNDISLVGPGTYVDEKIRIKKNSHVDYGSRPWSLRLVVTAREMATRL